MRVASKVGNFLPNMATPGLWVLELFAIRDGRTDGRTDKSNAYCPSLRGWGIKMRNKESLFALHGPVLYHFRDKASY